MVKGGFWLFGSQIVSERLTQQRNVVSDLVPLGRLSMVHIEYRLPLDHINNGPPIDDKLNPVSDDGTWLNTLKDLQSFIKQESPLVWQYDSQMISLASLGPIVVIDGDDGREYHFCNSIPVIQRYAECFVFSFELRR
jgi:hypothetical protein